MQQRFSAKEYTLLGAIMLVFLTLIVTMYMIDRQWRKMSEIEVTLTEQARDLRELRAALRNGVAVRAPGDAPGIDVAPAFARAAAARAAPDFAQGDWRVSAFGTGLKTISPLVSTDAYAAEVQAYVLESLIARDPDTLQWSGLIARDWEISEDGLTYRFRLRDDVVFSDGEPLTAADVVFTYDFIMDPRIAAPRQRAFLEKIERVQALGPHEVSFTFKEPYFDSLAVAGGLEVLAEHFYRPYLDTPEVFNESKGLLFGTGPYRLADPKGWTPDQGFVELVRNPRYWGDVQPPYERFLWRIIANDSARLTTFRNGEIDAYSARPIEYQRLRDDPALSDRTHRFEYMSPVAGYSYIAWNQERNGEPTRFADRRVRQALTYLTDRERLIEEVFLGYAEPAVSPFNVRSPQHDPGLKPRPFDLEKARALLAEAGFEDRDGDGVIESPEGEPFQFSLAFFQDNEDTRRTVLFLKDLYARAGILLEPQPTEWAVMLDLITRRDYEAMTIGWTSGVEIDIYQMFHSSQADDGGDNFTGYRNPALDEAIERARRSTVESERMPIWHEAERILYEDQPYTFLLRRESLVFIDQRIQNIEQTRLGLNFGARPVETYVPAALQRYGR